MKINNKISLVMIGLILLIANAIPIGRYLSEKQSTNDAIKAATISTEKTSNITKEKAKNAQTLPTNKLSNTSVPSTPFAEIGPTTNLKIKVTGPSKICGLGAFTYFLKYSTWEKKTIIQSNGSIVPMWTDVSHEVTVGGNDSQNIEVAGTKIADTEVRIKSSGAGWGKLIANKDLKWPKSVKSTLANTTYSIDSSGSQFNPNISFYYHIKGYDQLKVASYGVFSFWQWTKEHVIYVIATLIVLFLIIIIIILTACTLWTATPILSAADVAIIAAMVEAEATAAADTIITATIALIMQEGIAQGMSSAAIAAAIAAL